MEEILNNPDLEWLEILPGKGYNCNIAVVYHPDFEYPKYSEECYSDFCMRFEEFNYKDEVEYIFPGISTHLETVTRNDFKFAMDYKEYITAEVKLLIESKIILPELSKIGECRIFKGSLEEFILLHLRVPSGINFSPFISESRMEYFKSIFLNLKNIYVFDGGVFYSELYKGELTC